jgi:hypothetical protein
MKKIFIAFAALATLAACNKAEVIEATQDNLIVFDSPFVDYATKATDKTYSGETDLTQFKVYGTVTGVDETAVNVFDGVTVSGTVGAAEWSYDAQYAQYWVPEADYSFAAVVDADAVAQDATKMPTVLTYLTDGQKDLLYATASVTNAAAAQGVVNFTFAHLLSKAHFTVTSNATGDYSHTIRDIKVANFETGTYTIADGSWDGATSTNIEFGKVVGVTAATGAKTNETEMLLIPNTGTFNVTFTVDLSKDGALLSTQTKTIPVDTDLVKGNAYNFTIECSVGNPIKFTVLTDPTWTNAGDVIVQ